MFFSIQVAPLSRERYIPFSSVPANMCPLSLIAIVWILRLVIPLLISVQESPLSLERKIPSEVLANRCPLLFIARERTNNLVNPLLISVQESPLSLERNTPPVVPNGGLEVPANMCPLSLIIRAKTDSLKDTSDFSQNSCA